MPEGTSNKKRTIIIISAVVVLLIAIVGLFLILLRPPKEPPQVPNNQTKAPVGQKDQYFWSKMNEGPYNDRISYATSTTLTSWTNSGKFLAEHASVPEAIIKDGVIHIYFVDVSTDGMPEQIGHITSEDKGKTWNSKGFIKIEGVRERVPVDPDPYVLPDGRIRLYYFDINTTRGGGPRNTEDNKILSAISSDGDNFTQEDGSRFTYKDIYDPDVIKVGDTWRMYVGTGSQQVLSATSKDGLTFTYEGIALEQASIPNAVYENNTWYLFTGGIEISTSTDGKTFTKLSQKFDSGALTADPGVVKLGEGNYFMVYKTKEASLKPNP